MRKNEGGKVTRGMRGGGRNIVNMHNISLIYIRK
jgi:hypothetical protein